MKINKSNKKIALLQIFLLIVGMFAIAWMIGDSVEVVSAVDEQYVGSACYSNKVGGYCFNPAKESCAYNTVLTVATGNNPACLGGLTCCLNEGPLAGTTNSNGNTCNANGKIGKCMESLTCLNIGGKTERYVSGIPCSGITEVCCIGANTATTNSNTNNNQNTALGDLTKAKSPTFWDTMGKINMIPSTIAGYDASKNIIQKTFAGKGAENVVSNSALGTATDYGIQAGQTSSVPEGFAGTLKPSSTLFQGILRVASVYATAISAAYGYAQVWKAFGASDRNVGAMSSVALEIGLISATTSIFATGGFFALAGGTSTSVSVLGLSLGPVIFAAAIAVFAMAVFTLVSYQDYSQEVFMFTVQGWQPVDGGAKCQECNDLDYGCNEYQCHSYGKGCVLANKGTKDEMCFWQNANDRLGPVITPLASVLKNADYEFVDLTTVSPRERGVKINYKPNADGCVPAFSGLTLGVETDEPAECKIDIKRTFNMSEMISYMAEGTMLVLEHTLPLPPATMPSESAINAMGWNTENGKNFQYFIRCKDANGKVSALDFVMEFCVEQGPDLTPPIIISTNWPQESYVKYKLESVPLEVFTNEPATCRWDFKDLDYSDMAMNMTDCPELAITNKLSYSCKSTLTGIKTEQNNYYYIKCEDQPWENKSNRNVNRNSYKLNLIGTRNLEIDEITIAGEKNGTTIKDSTDVIAVPLYVKTLYGAQEGEAICEMSPNGRDYFQFYNNGNFDYTFDHSDTLNLAAGNYNYSIKCHDIAGNEALGSIVFKIETDSSAPQIVRVYKDTDSIKITTDEEAECVYSFKDCNYAFTEGIEINSLAEGLEHYLEWDTEKTVYVKCQDLYKNQPALQSQCSLVVKGSEDY